MPKPGCGKYISSLHANQAGVYCLKNRVNGKRYVGSSRRIGTRIKAHISALNNGTHCNRHLQRAWDRYGPASFTVLVLEICNSNECLAIEQQWIDRYDSANQDVGYNLYPFATGPKSVRRPTHVGGAVARANAARIVSAATRQKMGVAKRGVPTGRCEIGILNPNAKLTPSGVRMIRTLFSNGLSIAEISRRVGVGWTAVSDVVRNRKWTHVT